MLTLRLLLLTVDTGILILIWRLIQITTKNSKPQKSFMNSLNTCIQFPCKSSLEEDSQWECPTSSTFRLTLTIQTLVTLRKIRIREWLSTLGYSDPTVKPFLEISSSITQSPRILEARATFWRWADNITCLI